MDRIAAKLAVLATRLPRGGQRVTKLLRAIRPRLAAYPFPTRYGALVCDVGEPVCYSLLKWGEYPHWRSDEEGIQRIPLTTDSVVLDIGANIGVLTRQFASRAGRVHAFEPSPRALRLLRANVQDLANVTIHPVAVADTTGKARFAQRQNVDMSSLASDGGIEVSVTTIDALALAPDFIKIDVEGFEEQVLLGAKETLARAPIVMFEALSNEARERCERAILSADPGYSFERLGGGTNFLAWPASLVRLNRGS